MEGHREGPAPERALTGPTGFVRRLAGAALAGASLTALALPVLLGTVLRAASPEGDPRGLLAKAHAVLRWSHGSPATVLRIVRLSRDPDPRVREQAVLALGANLIVSDIEQATAQRPAIYLEHPVRDSLRMRLAAALTRDPVEAVRAEAARALWKAPRTFGAQPAAGETLAAVLDRALRPGAAERLAWLALDAAASVPAPALKAAAARFAAATPDTELARFARLVARGH